MADIGIRVVVTQVAEARRNIGAVQTDINNLGDTIRKVSGTSVRFGQDIARVGTSLMGMGRTLTLAVTGPIALLGTTLVQAGIQFESTFAGIGKTVEGVMTPMGELTAVGERVREEFRQMALEIPLATSELNQLGEVVGQLGIQSGDIAEVTELVAMLGATTELSAEEAATGLIRFGNIIGVTTDKFEDFIRRAGSALVALGNTSVSTEGEILNLSLRLAAAGDRANFSAQEIMAWATTLSDLGVRAEMGGTAVSRAITEMVFAVQSGSESLETFATVAGQTVGEFTRAFEEDASSALLNFIEKLEAGIRTGRVTEDMLRDMGLSGVRAIDVMGRLGDASSIFERNLATANTEWERQLALQEEFNKRAATVESQIQILKNQFTDLGITIFDLVRDDLVRLVEFIGDLIDKFKALDPATQRTILIIAGIAAAIGPLLVILGAAVATIGTMITAIVAIATPVGIAVIAVGALGAILASVFGPQLVGQINAVVSALSKFAGLDRIAGAAPRVGDTLLTEDERHPGAQREGRGATQAPSGFMPTQPPTGLEQLITNLQTKLNELSASFMSVFEKIKFVVSSFAAEVGKVLGPEFTELFDNINDVLAELGLDWEDIWNAIKTATVIVVGVIGFVLIGLIALVVSVIKGVVSSLNFMLKAGRGLMESFGMIFEGLVRIVGGVVAIIQGILTGSWDMILQGFASLGVGIDQIVLGFVAAVINSFLFLAGSIIALVEGIAESVAHFLGFTEAEAEIHEFRVRATDTVTQLTQGITNLFKAMFDWLIGGGFTDFVNNAIAKGEELRIGLITKVIELQLGVISTILSLKDQFLLTVDTLKNEAIALIDTLVLLAVEKVETMKNEFVTRVETIKNEIISRFTAIKNDIVSSIDVIIGKAQQLTSGFQSFLTWLNTNANQIMEWLFKIASAAASINTDLFGSPELRMYYGFESFFNLMNARAMDALAPMSHMANIAAMLATVPAPVPTSTTSNIDRSVNVDGINLSKTEQGMMYELLYRRAEGRNR